MKYLSLILIFSSSLSCSSVDYVVESDFSYSGNFNKYHTFDFAKNSNFIGSEKQKETLRNFIASTLTAWGYEEEKRKPDLFIFYSVFYDDFRFPGYSQPEFENWVKSIYSNREVVFKRDTLVQDDEQSQFDSLPRNSNIEEYNQVMYSLQEGTILISLYDRRKRRTVWQGYASGVFGENQEKNERIMRSAIVRIMDEYRLLAFSKI